MIEPGKIPHCTSNFDQLEKDAAALKKTASSIRTTGGDIHSTFQGLDPVYEAPEKDALLHTTVPVREGADHFASKLATVGSALSDFAHTGRPLAKRMDELRHEAEAFAKSVADDKHWQRDAKKQKENARLMHEVGRVWGEFQDAERSAADKISALVGNTRWVPDDGSHKKGMYGFSADDAAKADKTPWGTVDKREYTGVKWLWHHGTHFVGGMVEGFFKDGIWNTLTGLGHMANVFDWKKFKETWHGIGLVGKGIAMYGVEPLERAMNPMGGPYAPNPDHERAKKAAREFGKSLLAWDEWKKNPGRAIGTVAFNGITLGMGPLLKLGKAGELGNMGKAGEAGSNVAKVAGALGRAGQLVDPMTYIGGAAKYAKIQVGELLTSLKETRTGPTGDFLNGASKHPGALVGTPDGIQYIDHEGRPRTLTKEGTFLDEHGNLAEPHPEPHKNDLPNIHEASPSDHRIPVGVGASHPQASARMGSEAAENAGSHSGGHASEPVGHSGSASPTPSENVSHSTSAHPGDGATGAGSGSHGSHHGPEPTPHGHDGAHHADDPLHNGDHSGHADSTGTGGPGEDGVGVGHGHSPQGDHAPLERGSEAEQKFRDGIRQIPGKLRPKPKIVDNILERLAKHPQGKEIAEIVGSGRFKDSENFGQVVSSMGAARDQLMQPAIDQIRFANELYEHGVHDLAFEMKANRSDVDVWARTDAGTVGYQMKRLENPMNPFDEITRDKYVLQLQRADVDRRVMLVDGQGTLADWKARGIADELQKVYDGVHPDKLKKGEGVSFVIRLDDGNLIIPPDGSLYPKGVQ
ncbi:hypothetical protein ACMATS_16635 [Streptoverticillium reticulum]|uniref:hypothetical protein n=1 Tax=Streptoverticillium reticulum TaxID=1433415 RepID=UPI0039BF18D6